MPLSSDVLLQAVLPIWKFAPALHTPLMIGPMIVTFPPLLLVVRLASVSVLQASERALRCASAFPTRAATVFVLLLLLPESLLVPLSVDMPLLAYLPLWIRALALCTPFPVVDPPSAGRLPEHVILGAEPGSWINFVPRGLGGVAASWVLARPRDLLCHAKQRCINKRTKQT